MSFSRRDFLAASAASAAAVWGGAASSAQSTQPAAGKAQIAITLDLEMARNFPTWETTHWDYEKGNLSDETKRYAVEAARRVKARGGLIHFFLVARALEQENVDWLKQIAAGGHPIGSHTYDHVYIRATERAEIQYRFARAPWLIEGKSVAQVIAENVRLASAAIKSRLGVEVAGFRAPGGFADGLLNRPDVRKLLKDQGFTWVSTRYPAHLYGDIGHPPTPEVLESIITAQDAAQPFTYDDGLIEVPMSPISDIGAFRNARWKLDGFLDAQRAGLAWAIDRGAAFDFLAHPSVLYPMDPDFRAIDLICNIVDAAKGRAQIVDLAALSRRAAPLPAVR